MMITHDVSKCSLGDYLVMIVCDVNGCSLGDVLVNVTRNGSSLNMDRRMASEGFPKDSKCNSHTRNT